MLGLACRASCQERRGGALLAVVPGKGAMAVFASPLDEAGNKSSKGLTLIWKAGEPRFRHRTSVPAKVNCCEALNGAYPSKARKTTAPATSMGSPMRWRAAMRSMVSVRWRRSERYSSVPGVRIDGVHADSMFAPFDSQAFRQMGDAGFGHAVNRFGGKRWESRLS